MRRLPLPLVWTLIVGLPAVPAQAQQPLSAFLEAADRSALDLREARAGLDQARTATDQARARLLPSLSGQVSAQVNDPVVEPNFGGMTIPISPRTQADASARLTVPILDLSGWAGFFQAEEQIRATEDRVELAEQGVRVAVTQIWHQLVGSRAMVRAAEGSVAVAERALTDAENRLEVGQAAQLEVARARTEWARAVQSLAAARLAATLSARSLENLTGLTPTEGAVELTDDLAPPAALDRFTEGSDRLPAVRAAERAVRVAEHGETAAWLGLLPTIAGTASARYTSAAGLGANTAGVLAVTATWQLDFARPAAIGASEAATGVARVRLDRARQDADTAIFEAWHRVVAAIVAAEAALSAREASALAAEDARARYASGTSSQLDAIQAERDRFAAEVQAIQAIADLRVARAVLRIRSGAE